jgi:Ca-activated chloride channel family protein
LPLIKSAFQLFVKNLRPIDTVSIVTYGGYVKVWLTPTAGSEQKKILEAIESLQAEGDTPGESAIRVAYKLARNTFIPDGNNRIILATDGDFNVGETSEKALEELVAQQRQTGIYLTCLGVGMGNFKDSKLQILAKKGNGNYAYLDDMAEAERVLVKELTQTFYSVADDVSMNIEFNPSLVKKYRLIGFDNKKESLSDIESEVEGGEIGSGSTMMAIFEILPEKQITASTDQKNTMRDIASIDLSYIPHNETVKKQLTFEVPDNYLTIEKTHRDFRFAAAVAMFGMKLKDSKYLNRQDWPFIINFSKSVADPNAYLEKEFLLLLEKAKKTYGSKNKKKKFLIF